jgi:FlaA1/EpsC-like NDP-sugar epimerase
MHEELLGDGEIREPTAHPHIFRIRNGSTFNACPERSRRVERSTFNELIALAEAQRNGELVRRLWQAVA